MKTNIFKVFLTIALLTTFPFSLCSQILDLKSLSWASSTLSTIPERSITFDIVDGYPSIIVKYNFSTATLSPDELFSGYNFWDVYGFGQSSKEGYPSIPERIDAIRVPLTKRASLKLIDSTFVEFPCKLSPSRISQTDNDEPLKKEEIRPYKIRNEFYPSSYSTLHTIQIFQENKIAYIKVYPIKYNSETSIVRALTSLTYCVRIGRNPIFKSIDKNNALRSISNSIKSNSTKIINNWAINVTETADSSASPTSWYEPNPQTYLILSVPKYEAAINKFTEWKNMLGFLTIPELRDNWSVESVQEFIDQSYYEIPNLDFILFIGNTEDIPTNQIEFPNLRRTVNTDQKYVCMDGDEDFLPDIMLGRLPVSNLTEATNIIDKIIEYEKNPTLNSDFYRKVVGAAQFQPTYYNSTIEGRRFALTIEEILNYVRRQTLNSSKLQQTPYTFDRIYFAETYVNPLKWQNNKDLPLSLQKPSFNWDGTGDDIVNSINNESFLILHRDHGDTTMLCHPRFDLTHIPQLTNQSQYPILFSINCLTGSFQKKKSLSTELIKLPKSGPVSIIAATEVSYTKPNDVMIAGMVDAIWPNPGLRPIFKNSTGSGTHTYTTPQPSPTYVLGEILVQGQQRMMETNASSLTEQKYQNFIYHIIGDPSLTIPTGVPEKPKLYTITRNEDEITVSANFKYIQVGFYNRKTGEGGKYHGYTIKYPTNSPHDIVVTIYGHNYIPIIIQPETVLPASENNNAVYSITSITPNPSSEILNININGNYNGSENILFTNMTTGEQYIIPVDPANDTQKIDISLFAKGSYIINILSHSGHSIGKQCIISH